MTDVGRGRPRSDCNRHIGIEKGVKRRKDGRVKGGCAGTRRVELRVRWPESEVAIKYCSGGEASCMLHDGAGCCLRVKSSVK